MQNFTKAIQKEVNASFNSLIKEHNSDFKGTVREILEKFNNKETTTSIGFTLRRLLTINHRNIIGLENVQFPKVQTKNKLWSKTFTDTVAKELGKEKFYIPAGIEKRTKEWKGYLNETIIPQRETTLKLALALKLSIHDTMELLLSGKYSPLNMSDPKEMIIYYCLYFNHKNLNSYYYVWQDIDLLFQRYIEGKGNKITNMNYSFRDLLESGLPAIARDQQLIDLMITNREQFDYTNNQLQYFDDIKVFINALSLFHNLPIRKNGVVNTDLLFKAMEIDLVENLFQNQHTDLITTHIGKYFKKFRKEIKKVINDDARIDRNAVMVLGNYLLFKYSENQNVDVKKYLKKIDTPFSQLLLDILKEVDCIMSDDLEEQVEELKNMYITSINDLFGYFGYSDFGLYLPLLLDRFLFLSYLSYQFDNSYEFSSLFYTLEYGDDEYES